MKCDTWYINVMKSEELQKLWDAGVMKFKTKNECQKFL